MSVDVIHVVITEIAVIMPGNYTALFLMTFTQTRTHAHTHTAHTTHTNTYAQATKTHRHTDTAHKNTCILLKLRT